MALAVTASTVLLNAAFGQQKPAAHPPALPNSCLQQGHSSEKMNALIESVRDRPTAGAYNTLGVLYAQADRSSCAIAAFEAALKLQDQNWEAHYNLAVALLGKGDRTRAIQELQTAIQQKPDSVSSHFALGSVFIDEKKLAAAEQEFRSTVQIDPHFAPGALKLSQVLIAEGKLPAAIACLEDAIKQVPADQAGSLRAALGIAYAENGQTDKALTTLKDLVVSQPNSAEAHLTLGLLYARSGQPADQDAAVAEFREALRLDKNLNAARMALGKVLLSQQKYWDAAPVLLEYTRRQPKDAQGFYALGLAYRGLKKSGLATDALQHAVVLDPRNAGIRFSLGMLLASTGNNQGAIQQLEAAERIDPSDPEIHKQLALLLEKTGNQERSRVETSKANTLKSDGDKEPAIAKLYEEANQYSLSR